MHLFPLASDNDRSGDACNDTHQGGNPANGAHGIYDNRIEGDGDFALLFTRLVRVGED